MNATLNKGMSQMGPISLLNTILPEYGSFTCKTKIALSIFIGLSLASCASVSKKLSDEDQGDVLNNQIGAVVLSLETEKLPCDSAYLSVENVETGESASANLLVASWDKKRNVKLLKLPAGKYRFIDGQCQSQAPNGSFVTNKQVDFRSIQTSFTEFTVEKGRVVYPGTVLVRGQKATGPTFSIIDYSASKAEGVKKTYPNLISRFKSDIITVKNVSRRELIMRTQPIQK